MSVPNKIVPTIINDTDNTINDADNVRTPTLGISYVNHYVKHFVVNNKNREAIIRDIIMLACHVFSLPHLLSRCVVVS